MHTGRGRRGHAPGRGGGVRGGAAIPSCASDTRLLRKWEVSSPDPRGVRRGPTATGASRTGGRPLRSIMWLISLAFLSWNNFFFLYCFIFLFSCQACPVTSEKPGTNWEVRQECSSGVQRTVARGRVVREHLKCPHIDTERRGQPARASSVSRFPTTRNGEWPISSNSILLSPTRQLTACHLIPPPRPPPTQRAKKAARPRRRPRR